MRKEHYRPEGSAQANHPDVGYMYLVKNPSSNEISVCAWDSVLYPGINVVIPTRYGLDLAVVVADASKMGQSYRAGSVDVKGACVRCREEEKQEFVDDQKLVAAAQEEEDGSVLVDDIVWNEDPDIDECAECAMCIDLKEPEKVKIKGDALWIVRLATPSDQMRYQELSGKEEEAMRVCREKIAARKLDMKLVTAHFLLGEPKIIFFFTSDSRVDFRELVKDLVGVFHIRIELRQIGVRDESRVLGGLAICGRDFCCHAMTSKMNPVSIKMAKEQNLSLNSMKISGPCGRLLCCLAFEHDFYAEEKAKFPPEGSRLRFGEELMKVTEVNILSKQLTLGGSEGRMVTIPVSACYYKEEEKRWSISKEYIEELFGKD